MRMFWENKSKQQHVIVKFFAGNEDVDVDKPGVSCRLSWQRRSNTSPPSRPDTGCVCQPGPRAPPVAHRTLLSRWKMGHIFCISRFVHVLFCFSVLFTSHGCLRKATHRRYCEDGVDHPDSDGGVDGLTDAGHFKDGRRVIKDLGSRKRKRVSEQKKNVACAQRSHCTENACFRLFFCVMK